MAKPGTYPFQNTCPDEASLDEGLRAQEEVALGNLSYNALLHGPLFPDPVYLQNRSKTLIHQLMRDQRKCRGNRNVCPHLFSAVHWRAIKVGCLHVNITLKVSLDWKKMYRFCIIVQYELCTMEERMQNTTVISFNRKPWEGNYLMYVKSWFSYSPCFSNVQWTPSDILKVHNSSYSVYIWFPLNLWTIHLS